MISNTRELAKEYRLSHWAQIMQERSASGLSIKAYCETQGIHQNVYHYWQRKLRLSSYELSTARNQPESTTISVPGFAEVKQIEPEEAPEPRSSTRPIGHICVEAAGYKISADSGYPPEALTALLMALTQPC